MELNLLGRQGDSVRETGTSQVGTISPPGALSRVNSSTPSAPQLLADVSGGESLQNQLASVAINSRTSLDTRSVADASRVQSNSARTGASNSTQLLTRTSDSTQQTFESGRIYPPRFKIDIGRSHPVTAGSLEKDPLNMECIECPGGDQKLLMHRTGPTGSNMGPRGANEQQSSSRDFSDDNTLLRVGSTSTTMFSVPMQLHLPSAYLELAKENAFLGGVCIPLFFHQFL